MSRFLIADQDEENRNLLTALLTKIDSQSEILVPTSGNSIHDAALAQTPDLILWNIDSAGHDLDEFQMILKQKKYSNNIPLILIGNEISLIETINKNKLLLADGVIKFPIDEISLQLQIQLLLKKKFWKANEQARIKTIETNLEKPTKIDNQENQTPNEIESKQELLRTIIENAPFEIWARDKNEIGIIENSKVIRHYGSILGKLPTAKNTSSEIIQNWRSNNRRVLEGETLNEECQLEYDGEIRNYHQIIAPILSSEGIKGIVGFNIDITDKKKAEKALAESEEKFRAVIEKSTDGIMIVDAQAILVEMNCSIEAISGFNRNNFIGKPVWDFLAQLALPHDKKTNSYPLIKSFIQSIITTTPLSFFGKITEQKIRNKDGLIRIVETISYPVDVQESHYIVTIVRDITERKLFDEALKNSESKYYGIFNSNKDGISIFVVNPNQAYSRFIEANKAAYEILGYTKDEYLALGFSDLRFDKEEKTIFKKLDELKGGEHINFETKIRNKNGNWVDIDLSILQIHYNYQMAYMIIVRDITERKKMDAKLIESEKLYRNLVERLPDGVYKSTHEGHFIEANPALVKMLGYNSREELMKINIVSDLYFKPSDREVLLNKKKKDQMSIFRLKKKDGSEIWVEDHGWYSVDEKGQIQIHEGIMRDVTERRKAEKVITDERILLKTLINNIPDLIYVKDTQARKIISNKADLEIMGYTSEEEVIGKSDFDFYDREFAEKTFSEDMNVIQTGIPIFNRIELITSAKGEEKYISTSKVPLINDSGEIIGLVGVGHDITKTRQTEQKIIQLSKGIEQSPASIIITDVHGNIEYINPKLTEITGYTLEEIKGKNPRIFQSGYTTPDEYESLWKTISEGNEYRGEIQNRKRNGELFWESVVISPIRDDSGAIVNFIGIKEDITERKKAALEIQKLSVAIEQNPSSVIIADTHGVIEYVNKKFIRTTGYSEKELIGKVVRILKPGHTSDETYIEIWNKLFAGQEWRGEHKNRTKKREEYWEAVLISPIKNRDGKITNFIIQSEDISDRKKMEKDLIAAKEKAEESDRLKSAFLANMSHEIRTPLNSILGFSDLLTEANLDSSSRKEFASLITSSGNNLLAIINDVLDISKIEAGQIVLNERDLNAQNLITGIQREYSYKSKAKGVDFIISSDTPANPIIFTSDEMRIKQVLINFVGNAIKFTEKGYIEIGVVLIDDTIRFHVKDTGIGIPKEYHEKVFDRFRQVEASPTRKYGGNGLGLAITRNLAELLGGRIWLESEPNHGSTFFFALPQYLLV
ncbi:MAG: PAS domain S-box protein [Prolixibacteraceae bacterium]|nr:PAS domain S-box protein [Prolixibacteraceae bacterium]